MRTFFKVLVVILYLVSVGFMAATLYLVTQGVIGFVELFVMGLALGIWTMLIAIFAQVALLVTILADGVKRNE